MKAKNRISGGGLGRRKRSSLPLQPRPVLVDCAGVVLAEGVPGQSHREIFLRAFANAENDLARLKLIHALSNDEQHMFELARPGGKPVVDAFGMAVVLNRVEAGRIADAAGQRAKEDRGKPLQSQQVRLHRRKKPSRRAVASAN